MRILASLSITIFYCLFASSGSAAGYTGVKLEKSNASNFYKFLGQNHKKISKDDDPVKTQEGIKKTLELAPITYQALYSSYIISLHNPRTLRMKSSLSPPV